MKEDIIQKAKDYALQLLSYRERSFYELKKRLLDKGYSEKVINDVLLRFEELDYINDYRFAKKWVNSRIKYKPRGRYLLTKELRKKGVNQKIIDRVIYELLDKELEKKLGKKLADKWLNSRGFSKNNKAKLIRYLQNKGFPYHMINEIVNKYELK